MHSVVCLPLQQGSPVSTISDFSMGSAGFDEDPFKNKDPFGSGGTQADPFASEDPFKSKAGLHLWTMCSQV